MTDSIANFNMSVYFVAMNISGLAMIPALSFFLAEYNTEPKDFITVAAILFVQAVTFRFVYGASL